MNKYFILLVIVTSLYAGLYVAPIEAERESEITAENIAICEEAEEHSIGYYECLSRAGLTNYDMNNQEEAIQISYEMNYVGGFFFAALLSVCCWVGIYGIYWSIKEYFK